MSALGFLSAEALAELEQLIADRVDAALAEQARSTETWPEWMSVETAARYLDCSPERVRKIAARRQIPFVQERPAARVFFSRADLDGWMRAGARP